MKLLCLLSHHTHSVIAVNCLILPLPPVGGEIVSTFSRPEGVKLGSCKLIEEIMIGEDKVMK